MFQLEEAVRAKAQRRETAWCMGNRKETIQAAVEGIR